MRLGFASRGLWVASVFCATMFAASLVRAERPTAAQLLPDSTLVYVRVADSRELVKRFRETTLGRIGQDEQMRPLVGQLYGSLTQAFAQAEEEVGLPLDRILALPQGEMCLAISAPASGPPALLVMIEAGDQMPNVLKLVEKAEALAAREGKTKSSEVIGDAKLTTINLGDGAREQLSYLDKDGVFLLANDVDLIKHVLSAWHGTLKDDQKSLIDERKFQTIMSRCQGAKDDPPQLTWYVDPIRLAKVASRGDITAQTTIALLPAIGLDGLQAIGGSLAMATGEFDSIQHLHIMIDEPRSGVLEAIALTSGDTTPEPWVPADAASYLTINYDVSRSYNSIAKVYNSLVGENALQNGVQRNINDRLEIDFQKDVLDASAGRFTMMSWIKKPSSWDSYATVLAMKVKDPKEFGDLIEKLVDKYADRFEKTAYGTTPYWKVRMPMRERDREAPMNERQAEERRNRVRITPPEPTFAIVGDYFIYSDRPACIEQIIITNNAPTKGLANDLEFKLMMGKVRRQPGGDAPSMISFNRPEEGMRLLYDFVGSNQAKSLLAQQGERNSFLKNVDQAMKDNPLPPFAVIQKYLAPGGGLLTNDETGIHYAAFQLRRK